ncbi:EF-Hand, Calmodulin [Pseudoxanthomonas suwonensis 11-1]|uniref:EF-Hand, Calmodulin n=1 Tax=Pseudoxanthomonas suwonensis (strain 11-1) TaxID=743721 RepID=E6WVV6_PSEUU|nr:EF-hand domain-containing protein [Pseudoxanthomonas suwonensis]ADV28379.1 EF-Hand, Calmodulin [Pseudoxanthomonas suwonensis 11-1]
MKKLNTRTPTGLLFLGMIAAAPLAFAQSTEPTGQPAPTQGGTPAATQAPQSGSGQGQSWADLDKDGNGSISRDEAKAHAALSGVFATADTDGDGELTAEEYRTFIQNQQQGGSATP